jgi:(p)ppGpp synthase/HD superfamily hydrolase
LSNDACYMTPELAHRIAFVAHAACGQTRADGVTPYIRHPERVALLTREFSDYLPGHRDDREVAAFLHDVLEDTSLTREHLLELGITDNQLDIVERLTKMKPYEPATEEYYRRIAESNDALVVKCADRCANLEDATAELNAKIPRAPRRWGRYAQKTLAGLLPLYANLPELRAELEKRLEGVEKALPGALERKAHAERGQAKR